MEGSSPHKEITRAELLHNRYATPNASPGSPPGVGLGSHSIRRRGDAAARERFKATLESTAARPACENGRKGEGRGREPRPRRARFRPREPGARVPDPLPPGVRHSHKGGTCFRMLFMTPMKPANNLASSRAASFFSVFFLLLFSTPEAAILRQLGSRPGLAGPSEGLHAPGTLGLLFTKQRGRDCGCSALLPARPLRKDKAWRPPQKLTRRRRRGLGGVPTEPEPGRRVCALGSRGRARAAGSRGRGLRVTAARGL